ncbi:autophagy-related protein 3 [Rhodotorula toruloides]|uniref:Autophagy-related protein 3 n=1 Tax=Rhodotorula toruloides TaxID=5286 RepID=A0A511KPY8_RHOTO|nr:autophagy-related protein 3 [Rhodotorula toruloides]
MCPQTHFWAVRDYLAPVLRESKFKETGRITPDEFVAAGDFLVYKFPTWQWEAGETGKARDFLPKDKQYLISRNVPCLRRVSQLGQQGGTTDEYAETLMHFTAELDEGEVAAGDAGDEWVATHTSAKDPHSTNEIPVIGDIPDVDVPSVGSSSHAVDGITYHLADTSIHADEIPNLDDIPDMDDEDAIGGGLVEEDDDAAVEVEQVKKESGSRSDNIIQVRTYDCMITYDKYYQTPRMWLLGYNEQKHPLPPTSALEDVSSDHALRTVTIEPFPHSSSLSIASVHPCKHSSVMKKVIERMDGNVRELQRREKADSSSGAASQDKEKKSGSKWLGLGKKKEKSAEKGDKADEGHEDEDGLRVEQYLLVFLKFISTITPTIEVDSTASI